MAAGDIIPNGMAGDGPENRRDNAGEAHVVSGRRVAELLGGAVVPTAVAEGAVVPQEVALAQNYPNPFNSGTEIGFELSSAAEVELAVYGIAGQRVATLLSGWRQAGAHLARWDGRDDGGLEVASGIYIYRLRAGNYQQSRRLLLVR